MPIGVHLWSEPTADRGALHGVRPGHGHLDSKAQQPNRPSRLTFGDQSPDLGKDDGGVVSDLRQGATERLGEEGLVSDLQGEPDGGPALPLDVRQDLLDELDDGVVDVLRFGEVLLKE